MCGRYTLTAPAEVIGRLFDLGELPPLGPPRYNIAPSQPIPAVTSGGRPDEAPARQLRLLRWGLVPFWAKDTSIGSRLINARSETAATKPAFRAAMKYRRCLIPADGFYEWKKVPGSGKQPMYVRLAEGRPFAFAGLWESWDDGTGPLETATILTTEPNDLLADIHSRMPVILPRDAYERWLDPGVQDPGELTDLLGPFPAGRMEAFAVSRVVNSPSNDRPECIEPAD